MKKSKAKKLECCYVDFTIIDEARAFDVLLTRVLGKSTFSVKRSKKQNRVEFIFWATPGEQKLLDQLWDKVLDLKWDESELEDVMLEHEF